MRGMAKRAKAHEAAVNVRISAEVRALAEQAAELQRRTLSDWLRLVVEDAARAQVGSDKLHA